MLVVLFQWLAAHFFADFLLQNRKLIQNKRTYKERSWFLYVRSLIHAIFIYLLSPDKSIWLIPVIVFVSHYLLDLWKLYQKDKAVFFILDQVLHVLTLVAVWMIFYASADWVRGVFREWM